jgi:hypothetical protein
MKRLLIGVVLLALLVVPVMGNTLYGIVGDNEHFIGVNGATVVLWNATHTIQNVTFAYGPMFFPGVYWFDGLPSNEDYSINATKPGFSQSLTGSINTGGYTDKTIISGVDGKIYTSYDSGDTWSFASNLAGELNTTSIANLGLGYGQLATTSTNGFLYNLSDGVNWIFENGLGAGSGYKPGRADRRPLLSLGSGLALVGLTPNYGAVLNTTDAGLTWSATTWPTNRSAYAFTTNDNWNVTAGTNGAEVWRSTNNGSSWAKATMFSTSTTAGWSKKADPGSTILADGSIVLTGGHNGIVYVNDVWRSTNEGSTWTRVNNSAEWSIRAGPGIVTMADGSIVLTGGYTAAALNDVWKSVDGGNVWTQVNNSAEWSIRGDQNVVRNPTDNSLILFAGIGGGTYKQDVYRSTDGGNVWILRNAAPGWTARTQAGAVALSNGHIILMGGLDAGGYRNDTWRSTDNGNVWTNITGTPGWEKRASMGTVVMPDDSIIIFGGVSTTGYKNDTWRSTDEGITWTKQSSDAGWSKRSGIVGLSFLDNNIILIGGNDGTQRNDIWRSTDEGITWTPTTAVTSIINLGNGKALAGTYEINASVWNSSDYGITWQKSQNLTNVINVESLVNLGNGTILAGVWGNFTSPLGTHQAQIWNSTNNGTSWQIAYNFTGETEVPALLYLGNFTVIAGTFPQGNIYKSYNNGTTWSLIGSLGTEVGALSLVDLEEYGLREDRGIYPLYNLTLTFKDASSFAPLIGILVGVSTTGAKTTTTSTTLAITTIGDIPGGWLNVESTAPGYSADLRSVYVSADANVTINMSALPTSPGQTMYNVPHQVRYIIVDKYGNRQVGVEINATPISSTIPDGNWLSQLFGIGSTTTPIINATSMIGVTGSDGAIVFTQIGSIKYDTQITSVPLGINHLVSIMPIENSYTIWVPTTATIAPPNCGLLINASLFPSVYTTAETWLNLTVTDAGNSLYNTSYFIDFPNRTRYYTKQFMGVAPYNQSFNASYNVANTAGEMYVWGAFINSSVCGNVSLSQGITFKGDPNVRFFSLDPCGNYARDWGSTC